ncbi:MAG: triose-phosphate isomerase [Bacteroidales bacterium]|nr:triose-phosphate isomerase [Bacteroidales bacterium]
MRKKIIAGNWKMNTDLNSGLELAKNVSQKVDEFAFNSDEFGMIVSPPFTHIHAIGNVLSSKIGLSSQNVAEWSNGAYTGEISAQMVKSIGANYAILGHSERRSYFGEDNQVLFTKLKLTLENNLTPIFCIGEVLEEREENKQFDVVKSQIDEVLFKLDVVDFKKVIIAYEPVWAIGTGKTASPEQAQEIHAYIRKIVADKFGANVADNTTVLYGGSCKPSNADGLFSQPDIDGGLIGGAALNADDFVQLLKQLVANK